jgi:hypothetical protein
LEFRGSIGKAELLVEGQLLRRPCVPPFLASSQLQSSCASRRLAPPENAKKAAPSALMSRAAAGEGGLRDVNHLAPDVVTAAPEQGRALMAKAKTKRKYSKKASSEVEKEVSRTKKGTARSGPGGRGGKVKSRKQAVAIGLSKARKKGAKVPKRKAS